MCTEGVGRAQVFAVGLVCRRLHRTRRGVQSRGPCGKGGRLELQRARDRRGLGVLGVDPGRRAVAGLEETAAVRRVRRAIRVDDLERLGGLVSEGPPTTPGQHLRRIVAEDRSPRARFTRRHGRIHIRGARCILARKHPGLRVSRLKEECSVLFILFLFFFFLYRSESFGPIATCDGPATRVYARNPSINSFRVVSKPHGLRDAMTRRSRHDHQTVWVVFLYVVSYNDNRCN